MEKIEISLHDNINYCTDLDSVLRKAILLGSMDKLEASKALFPTSPYHVDITLESSTGEIFNEGSLFIFINLKFEEPVALTGYTYFRLNNVVKNKRDIPLLCKEVQSFFDQFKIINRPLKPETIQNFVKKFKGKKIPNVLN